MHCITGGCIVSGATCCKLDNSKLIGFLKRLFGANKLVFFQQGRQGIPSLFFRSGAGGYSSWERFLRHAFSRQSSRVPCPCACSSCFPTLVRAPGTSSAVIALSALLGALVLGNIACFAWCLMRRRKEPPTPPPAGRRDANTEVELGRLR